MSTTRAQPEARLEAAFELLLRSDEEVLWVQRQVRLLGGRMRLDMVIATQDDDGPGYHVVEFKAKPANRRAFDQAFLYAVALRLEWAVDESIPIHMAVVAPSLADHRLLEAFPSVAFHAVGWDWQ